MESYCRPATTAVREERGNGPRKEEERGGRGSALLPELCVTVPNFGSESGVTRGMFGVVSLCLADAASARVRRLSEWT